MDVMTCDTTYCDECGENSDPLKPSLSGGWPFVHSADKVREDQKETVFQPQNHGSLEMMKQGRKRFVRVETEKGGETIRVCVCGYVGCRVCETLSR